VVPEEMVAADVAKVAARAVIVLHVMVAMKEVTPTSCQRS
jgi:hypothetical protein